MTYPIKITMKSPSNYQKPGPFFPPFPPLENHRTIFAIVSFQGHRPARWRWPWGPGFRNPAAFAGLVLDWCWILRSKKTHKKLGF